MSNSQNSSVSSQSFNVQLLNVTLQSSSEIIYSEVLPPLPQNVNFDEDSINSLDINEPASQKDQSQHQFFYKPITLKVIAYLRKKIQVIRSCTLSLSYKEILIEQLKQQYHRILGKCYQIQIFQNKFVLVRRNANMPNIISLNQFPYLIFLDLQRNKIKQIDLSNNRFLRIINVGNNLLQSIQTRHMEDLTALLIRNNMVQKIDLSLNERIAFLYLHHNCLVQLLLPPKGKIVNLTVNNNKLNKFRFFWNPKLFTLGDFLQNERNCEITVAHQNQDLQSLSSYVNCRKKNIYIKNIHSQLSLIYRYSDSL